MTMNNSVPNNKIFQSTRILVVDDNELFLKALKKALEQAGCSVTEASNGRIAADLVGIESFDAVISDIHMPEMNGIQLLHTIKKIRPIPVILTTGFAELKETQEAHELGADGFLAKPFKKEDLLTLLGTCLGIAPEQPEFLKIDLDDHYNKISIDEFISGRQISYSIYIRLSCTNYVKIAHEGEDLPKDRISVYKEKGISYLYLLREDFLRYVNFSASLMPFVKDSKKIPPSKKLAFVKHTNEIVLSQLYRTGLENQSFEDASVMIENTTSILMDNSDAYSVLAALKTHSDPLLIHSVAVSLYSVMIAKETGWHAPGTLFKIAMGGLLHDIGMKEVPLSVAGKDREAMTADEIEIYESHAVRGLDLLSRLKSVPDDVTQIAYQHHEDCLGFGYPRGLIRARINPLARLVAVADVFANYLLNKQGIPQCTAQEAIERLLLSHKGRLENEHVVALIRLFKCAIPEDLQPFNRRIP